MTPRPLVKICGLTRTADALAAARLGADLLGFVFAPGSPRRVTPERAREIAAEVRRRFPATRLVGVFADAPLDEVRWQLEGAGLDLAQLHGDEPASDLVALGARAIRVFRGTPAQSALDAAPPAGLFLVDAAGPAGRGGTGESWPYRALAGLRFPAPLLVAGGIRPGNAARALAESGAAGIDVASGVESEPGIKDLERMAALMEEVASVARASR